MGKQLIFTFNVACIMLFMVSLPVVASSKVLAKDPAPSAEAGKSKFFCGYCHTLTYPRVMKKAYTSWKAGKHKEVGCVECHYPPGRASDVIPQHKKIPQDKRYAGEKSEWDFMRNELEVLSRLVTVLNMDEPVIRTKPRIDDLSCSSSQCRPPKGTGKESEFWTKKIEFAQYTRSDKSKGIVQFIHKTHFDPKKQIEGQQLHCTSCHQRETEKKHFEVSAEKCFLCHFKNKEFNDERSKCSLCHKVPTKPLQVQKKEIKPGEKPITHQSIEKAGVSCTSCHFQMIKGDGMVSGEKCLSCHDNSESIMKHSRNKKLMHQEHVAKQAASCFNCHQPIEHRNSDFLEMAAQNCAACHPDHHKYQKILLLGEEREGIQHTPGLMTSVKTNCLGCHIEDRTVKGEIVAHGTGKACAACHTKKHEDMFKEWKDKVDEELKATKEIEKEALDAIKNAGDKKSAELLAKAKAMVEKGTEYMHIVEFGGGVHNKKYSVILLDEAMNSFEDAIDALNQ